LEQQRITSVVDHDNHRGEMSAVSFGFSGSSDPLGNVQSNHSLHRQFRANDRGGHKKR